MLRLQNERMSGALLPSAGEFFKTFGLTPEKLALAKPDAIVMHPGPINRGVEIDSAVADGTQSVILPQVTFGIAVRMAVMSIVAGNERMSERLLIANRSASSIPPTRPRRAPARRARSPTAASSRRSATAPRDFTRRAHASMPHGCRRRARAGRPVRARCASPGTSTKACSNREMAAAVAGGVTSLVCPPDTDPVLDEPGLVEMLKFRAEKLRPGARVSARRADARPGRRGAHRDGRTDRGRLHRLRPGRRRRCATRWSCSAPCSTPAPSATRCGCGRRTR